MDTAGADATRLAKALGVSYQAVKRVLDGKSAAFTAPNNSQAARYLGVSTDWLATGEGNPKGSDWPFPFSRADFERLKEEDRAELEKTLLGFVTWKLASYEIQKKGHEDSAIQRNEVSQTGNKIGALDVAIEAVKAARRRGNHAAPTTATRRRTGSS